MLVAHTCATPYVEASEESYECVFRAYEVDESKKHSSYTFRTYIRTPSEVGRSSGTVRRGRSGGGVVKGAMTKKEA
ncbi:hypothetical protein COLO4_34356 [Corchorus olitorius]|uniref:Uncharacterized protein n=1 Tax=Corchorus olitorius TaxID=93759 RepID=A0A1R3GL83_9ROSI|nr:hypothetical protein COLO4_34356 [Corchorus olitorius]